MIHICFVIEQEDKLIYTMINKYKMKSFKLIQI